MLVLPLVNIEPSESMAAFEPVQSKQQLVRKDSQSNDLIIPKKTIDTSLTRLLRQIDLRDRKQAIKKAIPKKEFQPLQAPNDSLWNIYTGNPGIYRTEGDTVSFGNVSYLPDSLFLDKRETVIEKSDKPYGIEGKIISAQNQEWFLGILLIGWVIFASIRVGFNNYLRQLINGLVIVGAGNRLFRERSYKTLYGAVRLDLIFHLLLPLSVFQILNFYHINLPGYPDFIFYLILLIAINGYLFLKFFLYNVIGSVIMLKDQIDEPIYHMRMYYRGLGVFLLPVATIYATQDKIAGITALIMALIIGLFYVASIIRSIYIAIRKGISIFYLILYLCMLEIFPLILILKILAGE
jgi:hypothetical protein